MSWTTPFRSKGGSRRKSGSTRSSISASATKRLRRFRAATPLAAVGAAFVDTIELGLSTAANGIKMLFGTISVLNFGGGLQVAQLGLDSQSLNFGDWLKLGGLFSLGFGIINLLPGPIVDGLAMVKAAVEWIGRRPVPDAAGKVVSIVGTIVAFGPIPICIVHDVIRFAT